jgi:hypothetical protein
MKSDQLQYRREPDLLALALPRQLRQPSDVDGDPSRFAFVRTFARRASVSFALQ